MNSFLNKKIGKPNILLIVADQLRKSALGCYGNHDVKTPVLDKLAKEGILFENSVSASPVCAPYRATLQSGLYPHQHGVLNNTYLFTPCFKSLADYFNDAGYETCFVGKSHFGLDEVYEKDGWVRPENRVGWKRWYGTGGDHHWDTPVYDDRGNLDKRFYGQYGANVRTDIAIDFIESCDNDKPWLMQLNYSEPHVATMPELLDLPATRALIEVLDKKLDLGLTEEILNDPDPRSFYVSCPQALITQLLPQEYLNLYDAYSIVLDPNVPKSFEKVTKLFLKECYAMITCMDEQIGRVIEALEKTGQASDTIVLFTSDHGDLLCHGYLRTKGLPLQNAYRTPFIAWGPSTGVPQGMVTDALINSVDIVPTLLGLAGLSPDTNMPGVSQASLILGGKGEKQEDVLLGLMNWRAIFDGRYFYAVQKDRDGIIPLRLIDTLKDPYDMENLIEQEEYKELCRHLAERLNERLHEVQDTKFINNEA